MSGWDEVAAWVDRVERRLIAVERQLNIDLKTGLIALPDGNFYIPGAMPGRVRLATAPPVYTPIACTLTEVRVNLATASSSGSVTMRLNIGVSDYDTTLTSGNTSGSSTPNVSLAAGTLITPEVTAAGTNAEDMGVMLFFRPA